MIIYLESCFLYFVIVEVVTDMLCWSESLCSESALATEGPSDVLLELATLTGKEEPLSVEKAPFIALPKVRTIANNAAALKRGNNR